MTGSSAALMLGVTAALSFGIADYWGARAAKQNEPVISAFCMQGICALVCLFLYALFVHRMPALSGIALAYTVVSSLLTALGTCALYRAFQIGPVSMASPLSAAYPLVAAGVGIVLFNAQVQGWQVLGIVLLVAGIMAISGYFTVRQSERRLGKGPLLALIATVAWGVGYPLMGKAMQTAAWQDVTLVEMLLMAGWIALALTVARPHRTPSRRLVISGLRDWFIIGAGAAMVAAEAAINSGYSHSQATGTIVVALSSAYPVLTIILARHYFREKMGFSAYAGVAATIVGTILLL